MSDVIRNETAHAINGVPGRLFTLRRPPAPWKSGTFASQTWKSEGRKVNGYGTNGTMYVNIRFDDNCKNGHNTFAITADVYTAESRRRKDIAAGGCMHDEIAEVFPELSSFIRWHLVSTDGPMHYITNTCYMASDRDYNDRKAGEPCAWDDVVYFGNSPVSHKIKSASFLKFLASRMQRDQDGAHYINPEHEEFQVIALAHEKTTGFQYSDHYTFAGYGQKWHECPFSDKQTADEWALALNTIGARFVRIPTDYSKGKARELDAARRAAVWPDAPDSVLMLEKPELSRILADRLPALLSEFRTDMESAGFMWECPAIDSTEV